MESTALQWVTSLIKTTWWTYMSRHPAKLSHISQDASSTEIQAEKYVHFATTNAVPKAMTLAEIQEATKADPTLCELTRIIKTDTWGSLSDKQHFAD